MLAKHFLPITASFCVAMLLLVSCTRAPLPHAKEVKPIKRWAAYYDNKVSASTFDDLDLVVFDHKHYPKFHAGRNKPIYLQYVTMGEIHGDSPDLEAMHKDGFVLYHNTDWNSYAIDLSSKKWQAIVLNNVDKAIRDGFDGVMLDTVDSPLDWARKQSPERFAQMQKEAADLIWIIRGRHPNIKIMLNRGFEIAPRVANAIDYLLAESILSQKDNSSGQFSLFPPITYGNAVGQLQQIRARAEHLQLLTLDYWDVGDTNGIQNLYAEQRSRGLVPYVTSQDLKHYTPEPAL